MEIEKRKDDIRDQVGKRLGNRIENMSLKVSIDYYSTPKK